MRVPSVYAGPPGPPRGGPMFAVRSTHAGGASVTKLCRRRGAAERFVEAVNGRDGAAAVYRTTIGGWSA